jgi:hypothetical protein
LTHAIGVLLVAEVEIIASSHTDRRVQLDIPEPIRGSTDRPANWLPS